MIRRLLLITVTLASSALPAWQAGDAPFRGVTHTMRPRDGGAIHVVTVNLESPQIHMKLSPPGGTRETLRQTTIEFLEREQAQIAVNAHFFLPFPSSDLNADVIGLAASEGVVYSGCESPAQAYAIVKNAPAINIDRDNHAAIVHCDPQAAGGKRVIEAVELWNTFSGSAQIVTNGAVTIPRYGVDLTADANYSDQRSWYDLPRARTAIGLTRDNRTLVLFTVDGGEAGASGGMSVGEVATMLIEDYAVYNALNMDGGGSTSLAIDGKLVNKPTEPGGRQVASILAIFAEKN